MFTWTTTGRQLHADLSAVSESFFLTCILRVRVRWGVWGMRCTKFGVITSDMGLSASLGTPADVDTSLPAVCDISRDMRTPPFPFILPFAVPSFQSSHSLTALFLFALFRSSLFLVPPSHHAASASASSATSATASCGWWCATPSPTTTSSSGCVRLIS